MADFKSSLPVATDANGDVVINISDPGTPSQVAGVDANGDLCTKSKLTDSGGTAIDGSNPLPVTLKAGSCSDDYNTSAALAAAASSDHDYAPGAAGDVLGFTLSASGCARWEIAIGAVASETTRFVLFTTAAKPTETLMLPCGIAVGAADNIKITRTNRDDTAMDVYSTILFEAN
jgi:hypothetical protein